MCQDCTQKDDLGVLAASLPRLNDDDRKFALSLIRQHTRKGHLSPAQTPWVSRLIERAQERHLKGEAGQSVEPPKKGVDCSVLKAKFDHITATTKLKRPSLTLATKGDLVRDENGVPVIEDGVPLVSRPWLIQVRLNGKRSRKPGSLSVIEVETGAWVGYIIDGEFKPGFRTPPKPATSRLLEEVQADFEAAMKASGLLTGNCAFCNRPLSDERSTQAGYGPVCAKRLGLKW